MREAIKKTCHSGIQYTHFTDDTPLSIHVVRINPQLCHVIPARALNNGIGRECLPTLAKRHDAIAAITGGYFIIGGAFDGKSKGICKIGDRWFAAPEYEASSIAWNHNDLRAKTSRCGVIWSLTINNNKMPVDGINIPLLPGTAVLYFWALHRTTLSPPGTRELTILNDSVISVAFKGDSEIPKDGWVYSLSAEHPLASSSFNEGMQTIINHKFAFLNEEFQDVETPSEIHDFWNKSDYIMSGGPLLIQDGKITTNYDHDFLKPFIMYAPHPRSAVGVTAEGEWLFVIVEGRQPHISIGLSVQELALFLQAQGCVHALNLDGGASVLMVVEGNLVNTPLFNGIEAMEEQGQRRISDAFLAISKISSHS